GDPTLDASLLLMPMVRFPNIKACQNTTDAIAADLKVQNAKSDLEEILLFRYRRADDFGNPEDPFVFCSFWLAQAYAQLGNREKGIQILEQLRHCGNHLGLFAEHYSPQHIRQL